jgi:hypothetical protein
MSNPETTLLAGSALSLLNMLLPKFFLTESMTGPRLLKFYWCFSTACHLEHKERLDLFVVPRYMDLLDFLWFFG